MDSKNESFEVEFSDECIKEMTEIYEYIVNNLKENNIVFFSRMIYGRRNYLNLY